MLSCKEPGGLFAACELKNAPFSGAFLDRARVLPREKEFVDLNLFYRPRTLMSLLDNKRQVWRKLSEPAQGYPARLSDF